MKDSKNKSTSPPHTATILPFEQPTLENTDPWHSLQSYMLVIFGDNENTLLAMNDIKQYMTNNIGIQGIGTILEKYDMVFASDQEAQHFFQLLVQASNSACTQRPVSTPVFKNRSSNVTLPQVIKTAPNDKCPCGSGKKYKKCCSLVQVSGSAQLSPSDCKLFYETWYKLLTFVNQTLQVIDYDIDPTYPSYHDETKLYTIREKLWEHPTLIAQYIDRANTLSAEEVTLLQSWQHAFIKGQFLLIGYEAAYAVLMRMEDGQPSKLYALKGMTNTIADAMKRRLPILMETVLLPFGDVIVYDSFISSQHIDFSDSVRALYEAEYRKAVKQYGITVTL